MVGLLSLPRELRDLIFREIFHGSTSLKPALRPRASLHTTDSHEAVEHGPVDGYDHHQTASVLATTLPATSEPPADALVPIGRASDHPEGESSLRLSLAEPVPPTQGMLRASRQLRSEMQDTIRRAPVHYRIRLSFRQDAELMYPTWISLPCFANHIDVLDVALKVRDKPTASIFSAASSTSPVYERRDVLLGGLILLRRFLERGPLFVAKRKTASQITVDHMLLAIEFKGSFELDENQVFADTLEELDDLFYSDKANFHTFLVRTHRDEFLSFFAQRIRTFECRVGSRSKVWNLEDIAVAVDRRIACEATISEDAASNFWER